MKDLDYLGSALAVLRRRSGKMQKDISQDTGMSRSQVSRYERGRDTPNLVTLVKYLETIERDFRDLQDAIQEAKRKVWESSPEHNASLVELEGSLMSRLPFSPDLRTLLVDVLKPLFTELEEIKRTLKRITGESFTFEDPTDRDRTGEPFDEESF